MVSRQNSPEPTLLRVPLNSPVKKYPSLSSQYSANIRPHCFRLAKHVLALACFLTRCKAGIRIDKSSAIIAMTTKSSINVNACRFRILIPFTRKST